MKKAVSSNSPLSATQVVVRARSRAQANDQIGQLILADAWRISAFGSAAGLALTLLVLLPSGAANQWWRWLASAALVLVVVARSALWPVYKQARMVRPFAYWKRLFISLALAEGLMWAMFFGNFEHVDPALSVAMFALASGLLASAVVVLGMAHGAWWALAAPVLMSQSWALLSGTMPYREQASVVWIGFVCLLFLLEQRYSTAVRRGHEHDRERALLAEQQATLFGTLPTGVLLTRKRYVIDCNKTFEEMMGYRREDMIGQSTRLLMPTSDEFDRNAKLFAEVEQGNNYRGKHQRRCADGHLIDVEISMRAVNPSETDTLVLVVYRDITQETRALAKLNEQHARLEQIEAALDTGVWEHDLISGEQRFSPQFKRILGFETATHLREFSLDRHVHPQERETTLWADQQQLQYGHPLNVVCRLKRQDGSWCWVRIQGIRGVDSLGQPARVVRVITDISDQKERETQLIKAYREQKLIFDLAGEAIVFVSGVLVDRCNAAFGRMLGHPVERIIGTDIQQWLGVEAPWQDVIAKADEARSRDEDATVEVSLQAQAQGPRWAQLTARLADPQRAQLICVFTDITERKLAEQKTAFDANHDALTGLPNRRLLAQRMAQATDACRQRASQCAVLLLDLDGFKAVNDNHGHEAGDLLLKQVGMRLSAVVGEQDTVARLGGDEFVVLLANLPFMDSVTAVRQVAERVVRVCGLPVVLHGAQVQVHASVGVAMYPWCGRDGTELLAAADASMYRAKQEGKNRYCMAEPVADQAVNYARAMGNENNVVRLFQGSNSA
jgi:diguanylate cyclase (GGDEF)-like protein/PAS domain S-box-containing protein